MGKRLNLINKRFGRLIVIKDSGKRNKSKRIIYVCKCDCGNTVEVDRQNLTKGDTKSCGCLHMESITKHSQSDSRLYRIWADMIQRCENPKSNNYKHYGARGISLINEWKNFDNFYDWATKNGYENGLSIDRIDVNKNYEPNNCRWVTREVQDNNKRNTLWVDVNGEKMSLKQVSDKYGISYSTLKHRYSVGDRGIDLLGEKRQGIKRVGKMRRPKFIKTNISDVAEVKWLIKNTNMYQSEIASRYNISQTMVSKIKLGHFHEDVKERKPKWLEG